MVVDTGIFIEFLRAKDKTKTTLFSLPDNVQLAVSAVTIFELYMGATHANKRHDIELITDGFDILPFSNEVAIKAAEIYNLLRASNKMIEFRDLFIAATCLIHQLPLATLNVKHFSRIAGLNLV